MVLILAFYLYHQISLFNRLCFPFKGLFCWPLRILSILTTQVCQEEEKATKRYILTLSGYKISEYNFFNLWFLISDYKSRQDTYCIRRTLPRGGMYWEIHPPRPEGCKIPPKGNLEGRGACFSRCIPTRGSVRPFSHHNQGSINFVVCFFHLKLERSL